MPTTIGNQVRVHRDGQGRQRMLMGADWNDFDLVFTTRTGSPLNPKRMTKRLKSLLVEAGLRPRRVHDLRHSCGTILAAQGVPPR